MKFRTTLCKTKLSYSILRVVTGETISLDLDNSEGACESNSGYRSQCNGIIVYS